MGVLKIKRIYEKPEKSDGTRILVDRLWPRGIKKEDAHLDFWMKNITPSSALRKWFNHEPKKFEEFSKKYINELKGGDEASKEEIEKVLSLLKAGNVALLYAAKSADINHARVLERYIKSLV